MLYIRKVLSRGTMAHARKEIGTQEMSDIELWTVAQVAEELDLPHLEVNRRIRRGDINARKLGWNWVIEGTEVERVKTADWYVKRVARHAAEAQ